MNRIQHRVFCVALMLMLLVITVIPDSVSAANNDSLSFPSDGTPNGDYTEFTCKLDADWEPAEKTFEFKNLTDSKISVSFSYTFSLSGAGTSDKVFSENVTYDNLTASVALEKEESFTITIKLDPGDDSSTGKFIMTNISVNAVTAATVEVIYNSNLGSITGFSGDPSEVTIPDAGLELTAKANSNVTFLGWTNQDDALLGSETTRKFEGSSSLKKIQACFAEKWGNPWFLVKLSNGTNYLVEHLDKALEKVPAATTGVTATIVLMNDATLPSGNYSIPSNATLLIPFDDAHTPCTGQPERSQEKYNDVKPYAFRILKMASGAKISVSGHLSVAGTQSAAMGTNSSPVGPLGMIEMAGNSSITVESGGNLYVWGYIYRTGAGNEGTVTVKSGGTVYECFQIMDWRGGQGTTNMTTVNQRKRVFPISQYYVQNVQVPMTIQSGATEKIAVAFEASGTLVTNMVSFIGNTDGMFRMGSGGSVTKDYEEGTDRLNISATGTITMADIVLNMYGYELKSSDYVLPVNGNITITLEPDCTVSQTQDISLLPGAEIRIKERASLTVQSGAELIVFDADQWGDYCGSTNVRYMPIVYAHPTRASRSNLSEDAKVVVEGTLNATSGSLITTSSGASVIGTNDHVGTVNIKSVSNYKLYGPTQKSYKVPLVGTVYTVDFTTISVVSAKLHNSGSSYVTVNSTSAAVTYTYAHDKWIQGEHTVSVEYTWNDKTCKASASCNCGFTDSETVTAAEVDGTRVEPNCTETGSADFKADFTKSWATDQTKNFTLPTNDSHNMVAGDVVAPTCSASGYTVYNCTRCDHSEQRDTKPIDPDAHDLVAGDVVAPTCSAGGYTVYTCSLCGHTKNDDPTEINPDAHKYGDWTVVTPATCSTDGSKIRVCTLNNEHKETAAIDKLDPDGKHLWFGENNAFDGTCQRENCPDVLIRYDGMLLSVESEIQLRLKFVIHPDLKTVYPNARIYVTEEANKIEDVKNWSYPLSNAIKATSYEYDKETVYIESDGRYAISQGIAAGEMTGDVTVGFKTVEGDNAPVIPFYNKDTKEMTQSMVKTVTDFAETVLDSTSTSVKALPELKNMCKWAVTFGGYAQAFYETDPDNPAYKILDNRGGIPDSTQNGTDGKAPLSSYKTTVAKSGNYNGPVIEGQRLNLDSKIYMRTYLTIPDGVTVDQFKSDSPNPQTKYEVGIIVPTDNGASTKPGDIGWTVEDRNGRMRLCLDIQNIPPAYWNDTYTITITEKDENGGTVGTYEIKTSVLAWCNSCVDAENMSNDKFEAQYYMALAMYDYAKTADAYFAAKNGAQSTVSE